MKHVFISSCFDDMALAAGLDGALRVLAREGSVMAYRFSGRRFDCGDGDGFVRATRCFHAKRPRQ